MTLRILVTDKELIEKLNKIRESKWELRGNAGHSDTVRYLVSYHETTKDVRKIVEDGFNSLNKQVEAALFRAIRQFFDRLLKG